MARRRRSPDEIAALCDLLIDVVDRNAPMTVRQVFYQLVGLGLIGKTEASPLSAGLRNLERRLREFAPWTDIQFERCAARSNATSTRRASRCFEAAEASERELLGGLPAMLRRIG